MFQSLWRRKPEPTKLWTLEQVCSITLVPYQGPQSINCDFIHSCWFMSSCSTWTNTLCLCRFLDFAPCVLASVHRTFNGCTTNSTTRQTNRLSPTQHSTLALTLMLRYVTLYVYNLLFIFILTTSCHSGIISCDQGQL